ncbi:MAG: hypothetical protein KDH88_17610 [Chromatiales bacterium]|nr:hypothetical protein [Chromatiales bacterium]
MDPLEELTAAGLTLTAKGTCLIATPRARITDRCRELIHRHKPELLALLSPGPLPVREGRSIGRWLAHIGENDPQTRADVLAQCERDISARTYFLARAAEVRPAGECRGR